MPLNVTIDTRALELSMLRDGVPSHLRHAILALAEHVAAGLPLSEHSRMALAYVLSVRPQPAPVDTYSHIRPPEVF